VGQYGCFFVLAHLRFSLKNHTIPASLSTPPFIPSLKGGVFRHIADKFLNYYFYILTIYLSGLNTKLINCRMRSMMISSFDLNADKF
jgi:hypothetical protein